MELTKTVKISKFEYDPFIDFMKGICILFVIINHCIGESIHKSIYYCLWGDMAVPLFLIIQTFHAYKKGLSTKIKLGKIWSRMLKDFFILQAFLIVITIVRNEHSVKEVLFNTLQQGGLGSGSYYVWIYVQFAILLPLCAYFIDKFKKPLTLFILFAAICEIFEILFSIYGIESHLYRLLAIRYIFLIPIGYMIAVKGEVTISATSIVLSLVSLLAIVIFCYSSLPLEPWFYQHCDWNWSMFHWICFFFVGSLFIWFLYLIYGTLHNKVNTWIMYLGKHSYEIFLIQMGWYALFGYGTIQWLNNIGSNQTSRIIYIILSLIITVTIFPVYDWLKHKKKIFYLFH